MSTSSLQQQWAESLVSRQNLALGCNKSSTVIYIAQLSRAAVVILRARWWLGDQESWFTSNNDQRASTWFWPSHYCSAFQFCISETQQLTQGELFFSRAMSQEPFSALPHYRGPSGTPLKEPFLELLGVPFHCHPQDPCLPWDSVLPHKSSCPQDHRLCQQPPTQELWCPPWHLLSLPEPWFPSCVLEITEILGLTGEFNFSSFESNVLW